MDNINNLMNLRFGFTPSTAGDYIIIVYISSAVISPFFGAVMDKYGKRVLCMIIASFVFLGTHLFIAFIPDTTSD